MFSKDKLRKLLIAVALVGVGLITGRSDLIAIGTADLATSAQPHAVEASK